MPGLIIAVDNAIDLYLNHSNERQTHGKIQSRRH